MADAVLEIDRLSVSLGGKDILKDCSLSVRAGEVCAIMGPNGSGKSTLSKVLAGHPAYLVGSGAVRALGKDLKGMAPEERARLGSVHRLPVPGRGARGQQHRLPAPGAQCAARRAQRSGPRRSRLRAAPARGHGDRRARRGAGGAPAQQRLLGRPEEAQRDPADAPARAARGAARRDRQRPGRRRPAGAVARGDQRLPQPRRAPSSLGDRTTSACSPWWCRTACTSSLAGAS